MKEIRFAERFWKAVGFPNDKGCLLWLGTKFNQGYGLFILDGQSIQAHRIHWEMANDAPQPGKELHHICKNKACVNLDHLEEVTRREHKRKHLRSGCKRGHPYIPENTYFYERNGTIECQCKVCQRQSVATSERNDAYPLCLSTPR